MREFKRLGRKLLSLGVALAAIVLTVVGCIDVNTDIGGDYASSRQDMVVGSINFDGLASDRTTPIFTTRHYRSDSINVANQGAILMGAQKDKYFGKRYSGFFSQITPVYELGSEGFGDDPILDSVILFIGVSDYSGDTTTVIKYNVYEVIDDSFLGEFNPDDDDDLEDYYLEYNSDDAFELFNGTDKVVGDKMFSFYFPDQENLYGSKRSVYIGTSYVRLQEMTDAGYDYMQRLMLQGDTGATYEMYDYDEEWPDFYLYYKGLYVAPAPIEEQIATYDWDNDESYLGATYKLSTSSSGLGFYARTRHELDPEFIKDTIGMDYTFYDSYYGVGVNSMNITYHDSEISEDVIMTDYKDAIDVAATSKILVEGMGGIVNEITLEQTMFKEFAAIVAQGDPDNDSDNDGYYSDIFFNTARMSIYVLDAERDTADIESVTQGYQIYEMDFNGEVDLDELPSRLGMFYSYSTFMDEDEEYLTMVTVKDYDYYSEYNYSTTSGYDGYLNRSHGCYVMNIPLHLQTLWTEYCDALEDNGGEDFTQEEWDALEWNKIYVAPEASYLFTPKYVVLQGMNDTTAGVTAPNSAPIRLQIIYTLLR